MNTMPSPSKHTEQSITVWLVEDNDLVRESIAIAINQTEDIRCSQTFVQCEDMIEALKADVENKVDVIVTSANPISDKQKDTIGKALRERLGREVSIETEIDENLIGGAVIRAGDVVIDGSLRARLEGLANALTK